MEIVAGAWRGLIRAFGPIFFDHIFETCEP